jgi:hypothetical protein
MARANNEGQGFLKPPGFRKAPGSFIVPVVLGGVNKIVGFFKK